MFYVHSPLQNKDIKYKGKIILFDSLEQANYFMESFIQSSMFEMMTQDPFKVNEVLTTGSNLQLKEFIGESLDNTITLKELIKQR